MTEERDKDNFYAELEKAFDCLPANDIKLLMGDMNAKIGREQVYRPFIGKESLHEESNSNGERVVDFAISKNMIVSSTCFPRKNIHKYTWISADGTTKNQIDHVLISRRAASNIMNVRTYRGADCDSDHLLVGIKYRCRISSNPPKQHELGKRYDLEGLKSENKLRQYQAVLEEKLSLIEMNHDINNSWEAIKETVTTAADKIIGHEKKKNTKDWYDDECKAAVAERNKARMLYLRRKTRQSQKKFHDARKKAKRIIRKKNRAYNNGFIIRMQEQFQENDTKKAYQELNFFRKGFKASCRICRNKAGEVVVGQEEVMNRWKEFFEELLNNNNNESATENHQSSQNIEDSRENDPPTLDEVKEVIRALKNHKAPGKDNLPAELFKYGGEAIAEALHKIIEKIWIEEAIPQDWQESIICPIYKKGDKFNCQNYRGISLLNTAYKIFTTIIKNRMEPYAEQTIGDYQAGFRRNRSTMDQLFTVRQILRKCWEYDIDVYQLFIDFRQAYDSIDREMLYKTMLELNIPSKLVNLTRATMENSRSCIRIQGQLSENFNVQQGLKQGDGLAPMLFNLALEGVVRKVNMDKSGHLGHKSKQLAAYADDINCLARSLLELKEIYIPLERAAANIGLSINEEKTKIMVQARTTTRRISQNITIGDNNFERVNKFKYLGSILTTDNDENIDLQARLKAANNAYFSLLPVMKSKNVHRKTKVMLYKTLIRSVVTYGSEAWTITQKTINALDAFERKILRKIYGPVKEFNKYTNKDEWRIRYNNELYELYESPPLSTHIKLMRLRWAGHVQRQEDTRVPKKMLNMNPPQGGVRPRGRPRSRWEDEVVKDAQEIIKVRNWKIAAMDRTVWRTKLLEAQGRLVL